MALPTLALAPQTELDAVNAILASIGGAPVNTLAVTAVRDVSIARLHLHNASRDMQARGWDFNRDHKVPLTPDVNGKIAVPANALQIDAGDRGRDIIQRQDAADGVTRLYDRDNRTFVFTAPVLATVTYFFGFDAIPQAARSYATYRAGRQFQAGLVGSPLLYQFTEAAELAAWAELMRADLRTANSNILNDDPMTARIARRGRRF